MSVGRAAESGATSIARARGGDRAAFDALYEDAVAAVWEAVVAGEPRRASAEAMAAKVLMEAFEALPELPDHADFSAHCLGILARLSARTTARTAEVSAASDP